MSNEKNFIDGLQFKAPHERAPEYVKANGSIKVAELPKILRSRADTGAAHHGEAWVQGVRFAANQIEDALARQEADIASLRSAPAAAGVPTMSNVGLRKLTELQAQGYVVNGVSIIDPESSKRGLIDSLGYVGWHTPEQKAAQAVDLGVVRECLGGIADLSVALRQGGPAPEDLDELSDALSEATSKAYNMLQIIDQQAGKGVSR